MAKITPMHQWYSARRTAGRATLPWPTDKAAAERPSPAFERAVIEGLRHRPRRIPGQYLFDLQGSTLFERAAESPDYYLARTELRLIHEHAAELARRMGPCPEVVEWGAGSMRVIRRLIEEMDQPVRYLPLGIGEAHLQACASGLQYDYPQLEITPLTQDYTEALPLPARHVRAGRRIGLLGAATLGQFSRGDLDDRLPLWARELRGGALIVTVDQLRLPGPLHLAYNDARGLMAGFNLNLLQRLRHELGAEIDLSAFRHMAEYRPELQRVDFQLISLRAQTIRLPAAQGPADIELLAGEPIDTLQFHQHQIDELMRSARQAGFTPGPVWADPQQRVVICWLAAPPL